jgi:hypothetical protein
VAAGRSPGRAAKIVAKLAAKLAAKSALKIALKIAVKVAPRVAAEIRVKPGIKIAAGFKPSIGIRSGAPKAALEERHLRRPQTRGRRAISTAKKSKGRRKRRSFPPRCRMSRSRPTRPACGSTVFWKRGFRG